MGSDAFIPAADAFAAQRPRLLDVAYRLLGSVHDAEDVVQEAWLRWSAVDRAAVGNVQAFLVTVTTRLAIDRLRRVRARREAYPGPWLPEPISTEPDAAERAELAESVELALLVVLETLSPLERAAFVLHEAFGLSHAEVAAAIGRSEAATRQLARRAREHVQAGRPRFAADREARRRLTERFLAACFGGDLAALVELLADDVRLVGDGGGRAKAPLRVIEGADRVGRFLNAISNDEGAQHFFASIGLPAPVEMTIAIEDVNAAPAAVVRVAGRVVLIFAVVPASDVPLDDAPLDGSPFDGAAGDGSALDGSPFDGAVGGGPALDGSPFDGAVGGGTGSDGAAGGEVAGAVRIGTVFLLANPQKLEPMSRAGGGAASHPA